MFPCRSVPCSPGQPGQGEHSQDCRMLCLYRPAMALPWLIPRPTAREGPCHHCAAPPMSSPGDNALVPPGQQDLKVFKLCPPACTHGPKASPRKARPAREMQDGVQIPSLHVGGHHHGDSPHPAPSQTHRHPPPLPQQ